MNDSEKSSNKEKEKEKENVRASLELSNNIGKKSGNVNVNYNIKKKNSKNLKKSNSKKSNNESSNSSIPITPKITTESKQTSSSLKTEETVHSYRNYIENKNIKEVETNNNKINKDLIVLENNNGLTPDKLEKRNGYDIKSKERVKIGSNAIINLDLNYIHNDRYYGDCSSNINIENISSDDFESESSKNRKYEYNEGGSFLGENRTKKTTFKRVDKNKVPPRKSKINHSNYSNQFCNYDEEGSSKPCGCIGEQANALCFIF